MKKEIEKPIKASTKQGFKGFTDGGVVSVTHNSKKISFRNIGSNEIKALRNSAYKYLA